MNKETDKSVRFVGAEENSGNDYLECLPILWGGTEGWSAHADTLLEENQIYTGIRSEKETSRVTSIYTPRKLIKTKDLHWTLAPKKKMRLLLCDHLLIVKFKEFCPSVGVNALLCGEIGQGLLRKSSHL